MVASESNYRLGEVDKILTTQSKVNNNIVMLIKKLDKRLDKMQKDIDNNWRELTYYEDHIKALDKRLDKLEKDNEIDLETIKLGGTDG